MKKILTIVFAIAGFSVALAQGTGKVHGKIFSNFNYDSAQEQASFDITRAYFGYGHTFNDKLSAKVTFDVGGTDSTSFASTAYLKVAALKWKATDKLTINFGQVGLKQFKIQEKNWGYRYIAMSSQDEYKMGASADLGFTADYQLMDMLSVDLAVVNGEGFKKKQEDAHMKTGFGLTITPNERLTVRAYMDAMSAADVEVDSVMTEVPSQTTTALFVGYKADKFRLGVEYNMQAAHDNEENMDYEITSVYGTYNLTDNMGVFARYDMVSSDEDGYTEENGDFMIAGLEYRPAKGVYLSANFRNNIAEDADAENQVYMNLQFKF
jgi:hypothetical protein